jgi:hypothetical protein
LVVSTTVLAGVVLSFFTVLPLVTAGPAQARSSTNDFSDRIEKFSFAGKEAEAQWLVVDEQQQTYSEVQITLADSVSKPDDLFTESFLFVVISQYKLTEVCEEFADEECYFEYELVMDFFGETDLGSSDFRISNGLRTASAHQVEVVGFDGISGNEMTVFVDASWIAQGDTMRSSQVFSHNTESSKFALKSTGLSKDADATARITGDIELGLEEDHLLHASISKIKEGQMLIIKGNQD